MRADKGVSVLFVMYSASERLRNWIELWKSVSDKRQIWNTLKVFCCGPYPEDVRHLLLQSPAMEQVSPQGWGSSAIT